MCGISGIIGSNPSEVALKKMLQQQAHRGPDHTGTYLDQGFAALGHNRLSIIDLSEKANEPFKDNSGRYFLSFNGEIYNYKELREDLKNSYEFRTASDTEVLLAAYLKWGKDCLQKFTGMFSFAIWDSKQKSLFAARDRFGVKPFYYSVFREQLYFSSEIKALQKILKSTAPNEKVWANYFTYGSYGMPNETFFKDISQLPGGHFLEYTDGKIRLQKWYHFENNLFSNTSKLEFQEAKEHYLELLKNSLQLRFRADVPVAINVSGGVDSSLLLALVNLFEDQRKITAYTFVTRDERYDELPWVKKMMAPTNNPLKVVQLSASEVPTLSKQISRLQDEPFGGVPTLAYAKIFQQAQQDGVKVLLDGQGMDEQWAGYDYYLSDASQVIQGTGTGSPFKISALTPELGKQAQKPEYPSPFKNELQNKQYRDLFYTKIPRALRFNDRISMAYSTELREPFLDHHLVEFAFSMPTHFKIQGNTQKYLLRELLKPLVAKDITYAPKRPLQTPQREWLGNELKEMVKNELDVLKQSQYSSWFDHQEIHNEWENYLKGSRESSFHIWQWFNASLVLNR